MKENDKHSEQAGISMPDNLFELACKTSVCSHKLHLAPLRAGTKKDCNHFVLVSQIGRYFLSKK